MHPFRTIRHHNASLLETRFDNDISSLHEANTWGRLIIVMSGISEVVNGQGQGQGKSRGPCDSPIYPVSMVSPLSQEQVV
ncbi:hypothetical protein PROFUN_03524 [Planoprotostelium fungivorum]|uniref:Uncharacterized protein n=1 Tax=Planoprotostelium fungivorum TaxID=1890364 RepID=A0A2P6MNE3_9EUKA|nr:hypothetical protein PROFUN_03524 [Planoprotostelium fungivorum]